MENNNILILGLSIIILLLLVSLVTFNVAVVPSGTIVTVNGTNNGALDVYIQDQNTEIIDLKLTRFLDNLTLLHNLNIDDTTLNISTTGTVPQVSDTICLKESTYFYQGTIVAVTSLGGNNYQINVSEPLDFAYTTNGGCSLRDDNWAKDGSITPLIYSVSPSGLINTSWDITRVIMVCEGDGISDPDPTPDLSSFFTTDALTNGIVFRRVDGVTKNIFSAKDNFHLASEAYDLTIYPANRFGKYAVTLRRTFAGQDKNGVTIRLDSSSGDTFELLIRDDLTGMDECHAVAQGHKVE